MKIELEAKELSQEEAVEILATIYRIYHGPDRQVDETAQKTLLPLLQHYGFLGLVRVLKIVVDSSEMKERVKSELGALWREHYGRTPTDDEIREYGPVMSCLREAGPKELLPMIRDGKEVQAEASRLTGADQAEQAEQLLASELDKVIPGSWEFWHDYGLSLKEQQKYEQAIPHYKQAIAYNEDDSWFWSCEDLRWCYENLGRQDKKWYQAGIEYFQPLTEHRPLRWIAWHCLAWLTWHSDKTSEAIPIYREAINRKPDRGWHHSCEDLRVCYEQTGRQQEGFDYFLQLTDSRPDLWPAWHSLALLACHHKEDKKLAIEYYRQAIAHTPYTGDPSTHNPDGGWICSWRDMGRCLAELKEPKRDNEAEAAYRRVVEIDPKNWEDWHMLGTLAESQSHLDVAIEYYQEALRLNSRSAESWTGLGSCYHDRKPPQYSLAWLACQKAIAVDSEHQAKASLAEMDTEGQPWTELSQLLPDRMRLTDLKVACLVLGVDDEELGDGLKSLRVLNLLSICRRSAKIPRLIEWIGERRPDLIPPILGDFPQAASDITSPIHLRHLGTQKAELSRYYDQLTERIRALDTDLGVELDGERKLTLHERRKRAVTEREAVTRQLQEIERQLDDASPVSGT